MLFIGIFFNAMNILAYRVSDLYFSLTLFYGGMLMASNMIWGHELVMYFSTGHINKMVFIIGIVLSFFISIFLLRSQLFINDEEWLKRMISHHSTALTTSHNIYKKTNNIKIKELSNNIIKTQENEIKIMKSILNS